MRIGCIVLAIHAMSIAAMAQVNTVPRATSTRELVAGSGDLFRVVTLSVRPLRPLCLCGDLRGFTTETQRTQRTHRG